VIIAVLPARLESKRLARKLLLDRTGKPLICHTVEQVRKSRLIDHVIVATDSMLILEAVGSLCEVMLTKLEHKSGTDRVAECIFRLHSVPQIVVNCQADEPEIDTSIIDGTISALTNTESDVATACVPLGPDVIDDPSAVKVFLNGEYAVDFGREWKPTARHHVGLYVARPEYFHWFTQQRRTHREITESLEQLRAIENGKRVACFRGLSHHKGIDCAPDYAAFCERHRQTLGMVRIAGTEHLPEHR
jgi:3-deoxy-manno-octulosonate cytidylyltransferase (CMP-KDO synthetase)